MEVKFDWKNFEIEKPTVGSKVIFKRDDVLILGIYNGDVSNDYPRRGIWVDERNFPIYNFIGSKIITKSFSKNKQLSYPIYTPWSYTNNHKSYDFEWDYYLDNWL